MYLLFDIGGTKTRIAYSEDGATFCDPIKFETVRDFDESMANIKQHADELLEGRSVHAVGGSVAGIVDRDTWKMKRFTNLSEWNGKPFEETLSNMFGGANVYFNNDGGIVGLGEA